MSVFYQEEQPRESKRCKFLSAFMKEAFSNCRKFNEGGSNSGLEEEYSTTDIADESEVIVSEIRSRAMEKMKHRPSSIAENISWELYITSKHENRGDRDEKEDESDEFFSIGSCFSMYSTGVSREAYASANTDFSPSLSLNKMDFPEVWKLDFQDFRKRSMIKELCDCEGWPFGLSKKKTVLLLPPLPKSPSESWSWRKGTRLRLAKSP